MTAKKSLKGTLWRGTHPRPSNQWLLILNDDGRQRLFWGHSSMEPKFEDEVAFRPSAGGSFWKRA